jgi:hypothetical protein
MTSPTKCRCHVFAAGGLLCLAVLVQVLVVGRAAMPSRDAAHLVRAARHIEHGGLLASLWPAGQRPLFPIGAAGVHSGIARLTGESAASWATSMQVAAAIPLTLAVVPVFLMLVRLFDWRVALVGGAVFCTLPEVRRLGADGLGDALNLLFVATAVWAAVEYWVARERNAKEPSRAHKEAVRQGDGPEIASAPPARLLPPAAWLVLAGLSSGLAFLTRREAVVFWAAMAIALAASAFVGPLKHGARTVARDAAACALGVALVLGPCLALWLANRSSAASPEPSSEYARTREVAWRTPDGQPPCFTAWEGDIRRFGLPAALRQYGDELAGLFGYWPGALALWALWRHRREWVRPADRFLQLYFVLFSVTLIAFVARQGYVSDRHLLPPLVAGIGLVGVGVWEASVLVSRRLVPSAHGAWALVAIVLFVYVALTARPLRADRLAHRHAGQWLAGHTEASAAVLDTWGWTALWSNRETYTFDEANEALRDPRLRYVVIEPRELRTGDARAKTLAWVLDTAGERVASFGGQRDNDNLSVAVYRWRGERFRAATREGLVQSPRTQVRP